MTGFLKCPKYEAALRVAVIEHGLKGTFDSKNSQLISEEALFSIWMDAIVKMMGPHEQEKFLVLSVEGQKNYFKPDVFFRFDHFRGDFLAQARRAKLVAVH
jgi:hypothetical protein